MNDPESLSSLLLHPSVELTVRMALLSLVFQLATGLPLGIFIARSKRFTGRLTEIFVTLPMIFPPMALGFFLLFVLGKNGILGSLLWRFFQFKIVFSFWGLLIASYVVGLPFMVKSVQSSCRQLAPSLLEAAESLGKSRLQTFFRVLVPNIRQGILTGLLLAFGRSLGEVGISLMLGGNIAGRTETLSLAIYNAVFEGDFRKAAIFSGMLSVVAIVVLLVSGRFSQD
jgi:molybdate transport system permease protein